MRPIGDLLYEPGQPFRHVVASDCFRDEDPGDVLRLQARLADGSPLPKWMRFDTRHFTFTGVVPAEVSQELTVRVVANDVDGMEASSVSALTAAIPPPPAPARSTSDGDLAPPSPLTTPRAFGAHVIRIPRGRGTLKDFVSSH